MKTCSARFAIPRAQQAACPLWNAARDLAPAIGAACSVAFGRLRDNNGGAAKQNN